MGRREFRSSFSGEIPSASNPLAFALFLLLNAVLFIRPSELFPELAAVPIYQYVILACLTASLPALVLNVLSIRALVRQPVTLCVLGLLAMVTASLLGRMTLADILAATYEFGKVAVYFLLLLCNVSTPKRIRQFLGWLVIFIVALTSIAVLQWHEVLNIPGFEMTKQTVFDKSLGLDVYVYRLRSTGIFNDPNDLCLVLTLGMVVCLYRFADRQAGILRVLWLTPIGLFGYALALTQSRGGFVGLIAGLLVLFHARFGWKKTLALAAVTLPVLFFLFGGRQTDIDLTNGQDTAQGRIQYWSDGLAELKQSPLQGIGYGYYEEKIKHVAHNSFVHGYVELGVFGGMLFVGAFYLALRPLYLLHSPRWHVSNFEMRRLRPYLLAIVAAYAAGLLSLSRTYVIPTYMVLGLAAVYVPAAGIRPPMPLLRLSPRLIVRLLIVGVVALAAIYLFVRLFARYG